MGLLHVCLDVLGQVVGEDGDACAWLAYNTLSSYIQPFRTSDYQTIKSILDAENITFVVPKGLAFSLQYYPRRSVAMADVDVLVQRDDVGRLRAALESNGYRQGVGISNNQFVPVSQGVIAEVEASPPYYGMLYPYTKIVAFDALDIKDVEQLMPFFGNQFVARRGKIYGLSNIDVHYSLNPLSDNNVLSDRPSPDDWLLYRQTVAVGDIELYTLEAPFLAVTSAHRFYHELMSQGGKSLKPVGDVVALLRSVPPPWDFVGTFGRDYSYLRPALFYVYRFCREIAHVTVPDDLLELLAIPTTSYYCDWGDFVVKLSVQ